MINIVNNQEKERFITDNPNKLVESIQKYQLNIMMLVSMGEIKREHVMFSRIGYGE